MKATLRITLLGCVVLLAAGGCRQADRAISTPPTWAELPTFDELEPILPINVGVEGAGADRGYVIVPKYEKIEPTPEEREILGEKEEPELDALVFYRPPRGTEHGVSSEMFEMLTGIAGVGGALVGREFVYIRYGTDGFAGRHYGISVSARPEAGVGRARGRISDVGLPWRMMVGENLPRKPAQRATHNYR